MPHCRLAVSEANIKEKPGGKENAKNLVLGLPYQPLGLIGKASVLVVFAVISAYIVMFMFLTHAGQAQGDLRQDLGTVGDRARAAVRAAYSSKQAVNGS